MHSEQIKPKAPKRILMNFRNEFTALLNKYNQEAGSDTPDFILAGYLIDCLETFDTYVVKRDDWYSEKTAFASTGNNPSDSEIAGQR